MTSSIIELKHSSSCCHPKTQTQFIFGSQALCKYQRSPRNQSAQGSCCSVGKVTNNVTLLLSICNRRLSGYEPDVDVRIEYTGLRPGEKLYEELLMKEEGLQETANKLIHIGKPIEMDDGEFREQLLRLEEACKDETGNMKDLVAEIVPTYKRKIEV